MAVLRRSRRRPARRADPVPEHPGGGEGGRHRAEAGADAAGGQYYEAFNDPAQYDANAVLLEQPDARWCMYIAYALGELRAPFANTSKIKNPELDKALLAAAATIPTAPQQAQALREGPEIIVENAYAVPMYPEQTVLGINNKLKGVWIEPSEGEPVLSDAWLEGGPMSSTPSITHGGALEAPPGAGSPGRPAVKQLLGAIACSGPRRRSASRSRSSRPATRRSPILGGSGARPTQAQIEAVERAIRLQRSGARASYGEFIANLAQRRPRHLLPVQAAGHGDHRGADRADPGAD